MSRRPRRNRPPRLDVLPGPAPTEERGPRRRLPSLRRQLLGAQVTGPHARLGRDAVRHATRSLVYGDRGARLGCDDLEDATTEEVWSALDKTHGWDPGASRPVIDPDATLAALRLAALRLHDAAGSGARIAVATSRPASLLALGQWLAGDLAVQGARILASGTASIDGASRRELWWIGDVAVVTDGQQLLANDAVAGGDDWLFAVGRPDLVIADRGFAGAALRAGVDVVAWADLDAPALSLAAARGRSITLVPLDEQRPAGAYDAVIAVFEAPDDAPEERPDEDPPST